MQGIAMKPIVPAMLALLLAGSAGISGLVPAYAQDQAPATPPAATAPSEPAPPAASPDTQTPQGNTRPGFNRNWRQQGNAMQPFARRGGGNGGFARGPFGRGLGTSVLDLSCGDRGAEALEIAFVRIQYEVKPNDQQRPLFDALRTAAIADQKNYADACRAAISAMRSQANATVLDRFSARLALETARVNALNDILPKFRAFFDSLTDDQKAAFQPATRGFTRDGSGPNPGAFGGWRNRQGGPGSGNRPNSPGFPGGLQRLAPPGSQPHPPAAPADPARQSSETPA
jgi:hypothetical protein